MMRIEMITVKDPDIFLYMLKEDKNINENIGLQLNCFNYPKNIPADLATKIIEAFNTDTHYSRINIDLSEANFDYNLHKVFNALRDVPCNHVLTLNLHEVKIDKYSAKKITETLTSQNCPKNLTINLTNCSIDDGIILIFAKALSSGQCPERLYLNFSNLYDNYKKNVITNDGARAMLSALKLGRCPYGLQINFSGNTIDPELLAIVNKRILEYGKYNKNDILACVTLQQGLFTKQSHLSKLPDVIADEIYGYTIPLPEKKNNIIDRIKLAATPEQWTLNSFFQKTETIKQPAHSESKSNASDEQAPKACCIIL